MTLKSHANIGPKMALHTHQPQAAGTHKPAPAHLAEMLDSLSDGFMSIDKSWRFTYLNDTAERYLQQERKNSSDAKSGSVTRTW